MTKEEFEDNLSILTAGADFSWVPRQVAEKRIRKVFAEMEAEISRLKRVGDVSVISHPDGRKVYSNGLIVLSDGRETSVHEVLSRHIKEKDEEIVRLRNKVDELNFHIYLTKDY